jgi:hypothetical protein
MKTRTTPLQAARALRRLFEDNIAKTWDDYRQELAKIGNWLNAYRFGKLVAEQAGCSFEQAAPAVEEVCPELFADYWENLR